MEVLDPVWLMSGLKRIVIGSATRAEIGVALERIRTVRARADAAEVAFAQRLRELTPLADGDTAKAAQRHARHGDQVRTRGETAALIPALGTAFGAGDVSGEHVDAVTKALKAAPETVRDLLRDAAGEIVGDVAASGLTPQELAQRLADETKRLEDDDGMARLERQRRATRLRTWTDKHDGTFRIAGTFDPLSGLAIQGRLAAAMAAMFANGIPDLAPDDPSERQDFLRALALIALTAGRPGSTGRPGSRNTGNNTATGTESSPGSEHDPNLVWAPFANTGPPRFGRPEVIVVVDYTKLDSNGRPGIDWGSPIDLPFTCVEDLVRFASIHQVTVNNGNIVDPERSLDLGRTSRLANRAQRRALRALCSTCAVPGCCVRYEFTEPHHIMWWRNGGKTDFINLIALCARHHANAHNGWIFKLGPNRELTITLPTGQTMSTGPPKRNSA